MNYTKKTSKMQTMCTKTTNPYTYLIGWSKLQIFYYGVRFAKGCRPSDLWNPYRTSSKHVKKFIEDHGEPDIIEVRKTFTDIDEARDHETRVLKKMKVPNNEKFMNRSNNRSIRNTDDTNDASRKRLLAEWAANPNRNSYRIGRAMSEDTKMKIGAANSGRIRSEESKKQTSATLKENAKKPGSSEKRRALTRSLVKSGAIDMSKVTAASLEKAKRKIVTPWGCFDFAAEASRHQDAYISTTTINVYLNNPDTPIKIGKLKGKTPREMGFFIRD